MEVSSEHKMTRMELAVGHLCCNQAEEEDALNRIVTGDEPDLFFVFFFDLQWCTACPFSKAW
jgi:hypothetical protein